MSDRPCARGRAPGRGRCERSRSRAQLSSRQFCVPGLASRGRRRPRRRRPSEAQALRQQIDQLRRDFEARLATLEARLATIAGAPPAPAACPGRRGSVGAGRCAGSRSRPARRARAGRAARCPCMGRPWAGSKVFNPDMAVIGDFLGAAGRNQVAPDPAFALHESEASFQAVVDPYARADFFISFGEEGVDVEEGFLTLHVPPGRAAHEGRQDARGVRQGELAPQPRAALGRPAAGDRRTWSAARTASTTPGSRWRD